MPLKFRSRPSIATQKAIAANTAAIAATSFEEDSDAIIAIREKFLASCFTGQWRDEAVERILKYGRSDRGEPLKKCPALADTLMLLCDMRLTQTYTTGASQVWKSASHLLVFIDLLASARINLGWIFATFKSSQKNYAQQIKPVGEQYLRSLPGAPKITRSNTTNFDVEGAVGNLGAASTSTAKGEGVAAGAEAVSFNAAGMFRDEVSQHPAGVNFTARMGASPIASKPDRATGTPGGGEGIEVYLEKCDRYFKPACHCTKCEELIWLEPLDTLILADEKGRYFGNQGEVLNWRSHSDGIVYAGCPACGEAITNEQILTSRLRDSLDDAAPTVDEFLDAIAPATYYPWVGVYLSPYLRVIHNPDAVEALYQEGIKTENLADYHQQHLGYSSAVFRQNGITEKSIKASASVHIPRHTDSFIVAGIDQGTAEWFLWIEKVYGYDQWSIQEWESKGIREVLFASAIASPQALSILDEHEVDFCLIDNEPDRSKGYELSLESDGLVALADQRQQLDAFKRGVVKTGGDPIPCYLINQALYQDRLANGFNPNDPQYLLSSAIASPRVKKHLCAPKRDGNGVWRRPKNHDDDLFFAALFARAASGIFLAENYG